MTERKSRAEQLAEELLPEELGVLLAPLRRARKIGHVDEHGRARGSRRIDRTVRKGVDFKLAVFQVLDYEGLVSPLWESDTDRLRGWMDRVRAGQVTKRGLQVARYAIRSDPSLLDVD